MSDNDGRKGRWQGFDLGGGDRRRWRFTLAYVLLGILFLLLLQISFAPQPRAVS